MTPIARLTDTDAHSLDERVADALARSGDGVVVSRFTYWYTNRLPVHEALLLRADADGLRRAA